MGYSKATSSFGYVLSLARISCSKADLDKVGRHIFLGPSSAFGGDTRATRSCNAVLHNMSTVQAEHIGYICIQVSSRQCSAVLLTGVLGTLRNLFQKSVGGEGR